MPRALVQEIAEQFISTREPETLVITGKWGVGKTYAWRVFLRSAMNAHKFALPNYAYVSLFGLNSVDEVKRAIFASTVQRELAGHDHARIDVLAANTGALVKSLTRRGIPNAKYVPKFKEYSGLLDEIGMLSIGDTLVCLDDLERRGDKLRIKDVFGLISLLRDERKCKVAVLANADELDRDNERDDFNRLLEKSIDRHIAFDPRPEEAAQIAIHGVGWTSEFLRELIEKLAVNNIRIIKRAESNSLTLASALDNMDQRTIRDAMRAAVLMTWVVLKGEEAPPVEFVSRSEPIEMVGMFDDKKKPSPEEEVWYDRLRSYGWSHTDEFDLAILGWVKTGIFNTVDIRRAAEPVNKRYLAGDRADKFQAAWHLWHRSLRDNRDEIADAFIEAVDVGADLISPMNLSSSVTVLQQLGKPEAAKTILDTYIKAHQGNAQAFDLEEIPFGDEVRNGDVISAFQAQLASHTRAKDLSEAIKTVSKGRGYNTEDVVALQNASQEGLERVLKELEGEPVTNIMKELITFPRRTSAGDLTLFAWRLAFVLRRFATDNFTNEKRLARFHIAPFEPGEDRRF